jgi:iron-sulfur cluster repair protein YtfE (RIC family)
MKRHPALRELSSDHHHGLVQARRLVKAATDDRQAPTVEAEGRKGLLVGDPQSSELRQIASDFLTFWNEDTRLHFREEEEILLPAFARYGDAAEPAVMRVLVEHVRIRRMVDDLRRQTDGGAPDVDTMRGIGELLRAHIRYEEDVLFPLIEQTMPEYALNELPALMAAFGRGE